MSHKIQMADVQRAMTSWGANEEISFSEELMKKKKEKEKKGGGGV